LTRVVVCRRRNPIRRIRKLLLAEEEFRLTWDDYLAARRALRYFRSRGDEEKTNEYLQIAEELAAEIRGNLK
jgi:hypothetical protein